MNKTLDTLVPDIYDLLSRINRNDKEVVSLFSPSLPVFHKDVVSVLDNWLHNEKYAERENKGYLRMSNLGKPLRRLWYDLHHGENNVDKEEEEGALEPALQIKFLYGHLLEQVVLLLARAAGHKVEYVQHEVVVDGIKGHMDSVIDDEVVDIKTASRFAFQKFLKGTLAEEDSFGYLTQLAGYEEYMRNETGLPFDNGGFLVINKETGDLCLYRPEYLDKPNIYYKIEKAKEIEKQTEPPNFCYPDEPDGKAGNRKLGKNCKYCPFKYQCWSDVNDGRGLRTFKYSDGKRFFTTIKKVPKVEEIL